MSFADYKPGAPSYGSDSVWGVPSSSGASASPTPGTDRSEEARTLQQMRDGVQTFARRVSQLDEAVRQIGTPRDNHALRARVRNGVDEAQLQMHELASLVKRVSALDMSSADKKKYTALRQKLIEDFARTSNEFKRVSQLAAEREKAPIPAAVLKSAQAGGSAVLTTQESQALLEAERREQAEQLESRRAFVDGVNLEREEEVRQLEANVAQVNEMFKDLAHIIEEQGVLIDNIDANVSHAVEEVEEGEKQVDKAAHYQKKSRSKMCCILATSVAILIVVVILIVVPTVLSRR